MPLPYLKPEFQCEATCRARGERCLNFRAFGARTCRYHGARRIPPKGELNGQFKNGEHRGARERLTKNREIRELVDHGVASGLFPMDTSFGPGRRPKPK